MAGIDAKGDTVLFPQMGQDGLLIGGCRVFP